ncbi:CAAX prenyl protease 1 homolog [Oratosquilla oratoria]|uniref:CAAX prenyl protease 1 homolog n=1 Tax=Oratosquilla oratoria TaxID=337810 RepID=UPI003F771AE3
MLTLAIPEWQSWEGKMFIGIVGFSWATYLWEEYLSYRQRQIYKKNVIPPEELKAIIERETYDKARAYNLDKSSYGLLERAFNQVLNTGIMLYGGLPALWNVSGSLSQWLGFSASNEIAHSIVFVSVGSIISRIINLPWSVYFTFKIEQKHGFNKQTPGFYIKDKIKKIVVSQVISAPLVAGVVYIIKAGGDYFFWYLWGFTTITGFLLMTIYPDYIAPLFDKYEPLPDGELRTKIEELAARISFPLTKLYVVEGSKRSAHSNAYFYGFFKNKRIVLYDTLLEEYTPINKTIEDTKEEEKEKEAGSEEKKENAIDAKDDTAEDHTEEKDTKEEEEEEATDKDDAEDGKRKKSGCKTNEVLAVLGHELGHWKLNHVLKNIVISQVNLFLIFSVFGSLYGYTPLYHAFGFHNSKPAFIGLILVTQYVFAPYNELLGVLITMFSRYSEFQADEFARKLGYSEQLQSALVKLNNDNLGFPVYDWLFSAWHHSHPPILERIRALQEKVKED